MGKWFAWLFGMVLAVGCTFEAMAVKVVMVSPVGLHPAVRGFRDAITKQIPEAKVFLWEVKTDDYPGLPDRIRNEKPDLIFTWGTPVTLAIAGRHDQPNGIKDIPVVFCFVADPVRAKLVADSTKPGRNVTGASHLAPLATQFRSIRQYDTLNKLGVVYNPIEPNAIAMVEALKAESGPSNVELILESVDVLPDGKPDPASIPGKIAKVKAAGADWLYMGPDTFISLTHRAIVTRAALENNLPTFAATETPIRSGDGLYGLYSASENVGRFAAFKAAQILRKQKPIGEIPIETLQRFVVIINITVAKALNRIPPLALLKIADVRDAPLTPAPPPPAAAPTPAPGQPTNPPTTPTAPATPAQAGSPATGSPSRAPGAVAAPLKPGTSSPPLAPKATPLAPNIPAGPPKATQPAAPPKPAAASADSAKAPQPTPAAAANAGNPNAAPTVAPKGSAASSSPPVSPPPSASSPTTSPATGTPGK
jgi:putative tryptophan/tyrosine transport system substrate-binding protein